MSAYCVFGASPCIASVIVPDRPITVSTSNCTSMVDGVVPNDSAGYDELPASTQRVTNPLHESTPLADMAALPVATTVYAT